MKTPDPHHPNYFFKSALLLAAALELQSAPAQFTFSVYKFFSEYPLLTKIAKLDASSGFNWTAGKSSSSTSPVATKAAVLLYPGLLPGSGVTPYGILAQTGVGRTAGTPFSPQATNDGTTIYVSFLLSPLTFPSAALNGGYCAILELHGLTANPATVAPDPRVGPAVLINSLGQLQISKTEDAFNAAGEIYFHRRFIFPPKFPLKTWRNCSMLTPWKNLISMWR